MLAITGVVDHPGKDEPLLTINISQNVVCVICSVESFDLAWLNTGLLSFMMEAYLFKAPVPLHPPQYTVFPRAECTEGIGGWQAEKSPPDSKRSHLQNQESKRNSQLREATSSGNLTQRIPSENIPSLPPNSPHRPGSGIRVAIWSLLWKHLPVLWHSVSSWLCSQH